LTSGNKFILVSLLCREMALGGALLRQVGAKWAAEQPCLPSRSRAPRRE